MERMLQLNFSRETSINKNYYQPEREELFSSGPRKTGKSSLLYEINEELEFGVYVGLESRINHYGLKVHSLED